MLAELDVVIFLKSHDDLERTAARVFGVLHSTYHPGESEELGGACYEATGLGFRAALFSNSGEVQDPEFEDFSYALEITSQFWCVELDTIDLEGPLSEYFARQLAFELNLETGTEILVDTTEEAEIFEIRAYRRNPQYRLDQAPTTPKVFVVETREVEVPFDEEETEEEWGEDEGEETEENGVEEDEDQVPRDE